MKGFSTTVVVVATLFLPRLCVAVAGTTLKPSFAPIAGSQAPTVPAPPTFGSPTHSPTGVSHNITITHYAKSVSCQGTPYKKEVYLAPHLTEAICQFYIPPGSNVRVWKGYCAAQQIVGDSGQTRPVVDLQFWFSPTTTTCPPTYANGAEVATSVSALSGDGTCYTGVFPTTDITIVHDCTVTSLASRLGAQIVTFGVMIGLWLFADQMM